MIRLLWLLSNSECCVKNLMLIRKRQDRAKVRTSIIPFYSKCYSFLTYEYQIANAYDKAGQIKFQIMKV